MKKITKLLYIVITITVAVNLAACKKLSSFDYPSPTGSAYDVIKDDGAYSYFRTIIDKANLKDMLSGSAEYTVFVPTNTAFINAGYTLTMLQQMAGADLAVIVKNHIIEGKVDVKSLNGPQTSLSSQQLTVQNINDETYVDGGDVTNSNITISNGYLNVTDKLLVTRNTLLDVINTYANATANNTFTFLAAAISRASTGSTNFTALLGGPDAYTLFAPTNSAFIDGGYPTLASVQSANPETLGNILKYHLIAGNKLTTAFDSVPVQSYNGTNIYFDKVRNAKTRTSFWYANGIKFGNDQTSNLMAGNGVLHSVFRLLPAPVTTNTLSYIQANANLSLFYALIVRASEADPNVNFQQMLSDPSKSYTVFAINNAGLQAAGYRDVAAINTESPIALSRVLRFHMISRRLNNINVIEDGEVATVLGPVLTFTLAGGYQIKGGTNVNSVPVITPNVVTTNGLVNIIGTVLTP